MYSILKYFIYLSIKKKRKIVFEINKNVNYIFWNNT